MGKVSIYVEMEGFCKPQRPFFKLSVIDTFKVTKAPSALESFHFSHFPMGLRTFKFAGCAIITRNYGVRKPLFLN